MSLTASIILESLVNQSSSVWFSRRIKEENLEESIQAEYANVETKEVKVGDIAWFSNQATADDVVSTRKALAQMNLHLYSKELAESSKKGNPVMRKTSSGAFSFIVLPNEGIRVDSNNNDNPF
jgi:hypothetical protein|tara:strand:- start:242 stop:610 length:369 start_codon:yes stop_codon:yes gene_type:complete